MPRKLRRDIHTGKLNGRAPEARENCARYAVFAHDWNDIPHLIITTNNGNDATRSVQDALCEAWPRGIIYDEVTEVHTRWIYDELLGVRLEQEVMG